MDRTKILIPPDESYRDSQEYIDISSEPNFVGNTQFLEDNNLSPIGSLDSGLLTEEFYNFITNNNLNTTVGWESNIEPITDSSLIYFNGLTRYILTINNIDVLCYTYYNIQNIKSILLYIRQLYTPLQKLRDSRIKNTVFFIKDDSASEKDIEYFTKYSFDEYIINNDIVGYNSKKVYFNENKIETRLVQHDWDNFSIIDTSNNLIDDDILYRLTNITITLETTAPFTKQDFLRGEISIASEGNGYKGLSLFSGNFNELFQNNYVEQLINEIGITTTEVIVDSEPPIIN